MIYKKLLDAIQSNVNQKPLKIALIDPDKKNDMTLSDQIEYIKRNDFIAVFCGGSIMMDAMYHKRISYIRKNIDLPLIGFPGSVSQINENFDALLYMSLISGRNPQYLIGEQVLSAPIIHDLSLETIPIGYIILNNGKKTSVEIISGTDGLPMSNHDVVLAHVLASQYLGHKMIYLECGSDSEKIIDIDLLKKIKKNVNVPLIVGGGIKNQEDIEIISDCGADFIVVSSMIESYVNL